MPRRRKVVERKGGSNGTENRLSEDCAGRDLSNVRPGELCAEERPGACPSGIGEAASLPNEGCAYCVDMHTKDARTRGESEQRLHAIVVWRETPFFTERERAALEWAEAVTQVSHEHVPDEVYESAHRHFSDKELVDLTLAIIAINGWNRLAISFRTIPGTYQPKTKAGGDSSSIYPSEPTVTTTGKTAVTESNEDGERK